ncbi:hypothetical protein H5968_00580 [Sphaerospermopsis sp. LEGE 00249]|uniref:hypothetical protein n=1 Tax=Sphaerospermopsis sp. LEGE 00249 TaxID=1380707 RepID=UPI00164E84EA|nr:hypothetical protein [Sphaerospermopsis sp. LEGE 00249]MBC5793691.1 hypothetical protein [Sphaerospermopsis sp. LEGE 00249]
MIYQGFRFIQQTLNNYLFTVPSHQSPVTSPQRCTELVEVSPVPSPQRCTELVEVSPVPSLQRCTELVEVSPVPNN